MLKLSEGKQWNALEDYVEGSVHTFGFYQVTEPEVLWFAKQFDPQDMHLNREKASVGEYGGLIASGWHTAGMMMRLLADNFLPGSANLASPGIDELRWLAPVRPGDRLAIRVTVLEVRRSRSKPDRGVLRTAIETISDKMSTVMTVRCVSIIRTREGLEPLFLPFTSSGLNLG